MSISEMIRQDRLEDAVSQVLDEYCTHTKPIKHLLLSRLMHVLDRFQKERSFVWKLKPRVGAIALSKNNELGLITDVPSVSGFVYHGIHLSTEKFGQHWQSTEPRVVGYMDSLLGGLDVKKFVQ
jgi:hypothetical protein